MTPKSLSLSRAQRCRRSARFIRYLRRAGVDPWLDEEKLLPGADWELEIRKAVRESAVVIVSLSRQFNQAGYRQKEVKLALDTADEKLEGDIFIIPARQSRKSCLASLSGDTMNLFPQLQTMSYGKERRCVRQRFFS